MKIRLVRRSIAILASCVMLPCAALTVEGVHAAGAATAPSWIAHGASMKPGRLMILKLKRPVRATCSLRVTGPKVHPRKWTYAAGIGLIQFAVHPPAGVRAGTWTFAATCVPSGTTVVTHDSTKIKVKNARKGGVFIVGAHGPVVHVPVRRGTTRLHNLPPVGGRGGGSGNDYPYQGKQMDSGLDPWGEYYRECTSFVAWALHSRNNFDMPFFDNAIGWGSDAARRGYTVNSTPAVGSVAWGTKLPFGHVAWVSAVSGGSVTVDEYNEYGNGSYDQRTVPASTFQYIHFKDLPSAPTMPPPPVPPTQPPPPPAPTTYAETVGGVTHTWTNYSNAGGTQGASIATSQTVQIACKLTGFAVADGNTWWYRIASSPWNSSFYASADAFYNNGQTSGSLHGTPFVDPSVPSC